MAKFKKIFFIKTLFCGVFYSVIKSQFPTVSVFSLIKNVFVPRTSNVKFVRT